MFTTILEILIVIIGVAILALQFSNRRKTGNLIAAVVGGNSSIGSVENKKKHDIWDIENGPNDPLTKENNTLSSPYDVANHHHHSYNHHYSSSSSQPYYDNGINSSSAMTPNNNNLRWRRDSTISAYDGGNVNSSSASASFSGGNIHNQHTFQPPVPFGSPFYTTYPSYTNGNGNTNTPLYPAYVSPLGPSSVSSSIRLGGTNNIISSTNFTNTTSTYPSNPSLYTSSYDPSASSPYAGNNDTIPSSPWNTSSLHPPPQQQYTSSSSYENYTAPHPANTLSPSYPPWLNTTLNNKENANTDINDTGLPSIPMVSPTTNLDYVGSANPFDNNNKYHTENTPTATPTTAAAFANPPNNQPYSETHSLTENKKPIEPSNASESVNDSTAPTSPVPNPAPVPVIPPPQLAVLGGGSLNILAFGKLQFVNVQKDQPIWKPRPAPVPAPVPAPAPVEVMSSTKTEESSVSSSDGNNDDTVPETTASMTEVIPTNPPILHETETNSSAQSLDNTVPDPRRATTTTTTTPPSSSSVAPVMYTRTPRADFDIDWNALQLGPEIGQGAFGRVYRAKWRGTSVAVKALYTNGLNLTGQEIEDLRAEIATLSALRHPNILLFMGACTEAPHACLVTEFMPRGSLWDLLHTPDNNSHDSTSTKPRPLEMNYILRASLDIAKGMAYLHSASPPILHRDLKSPNLLLDDSFGVKISDFGLARVKASTLTMTGGTGTFQWMAPEVLANQRYTEKADIYSYGIILWELLTREVPYGDMQQIQVAIAVLTTGLRPTIPNDTPVGLRKLITDCWHADALQRPDFLEIIERLEWIMEEEQNTVNRKVI